MNAMNMSLIETRRARLSVDRRLQIASQADQCVRWLKVQGFEVLHVYKPLFQPPYSPPRIIVKQSHLCDKLQGVAEGFEATPHGTARYSFVMRFDCEVRWNAMGEFKQWELKQKRTYLAGSLLRRMLAAFDCVFGGEA